MNRITGSDIMITLVLTILFLYPHAPAALAALKGEDHDAKCSSVDGRTVEVTCKMTFAQLAKNVNDETILKNLGNGQYLLSADLRVDRGARLTLSSPEVTWLKISSTGSPEQYNIVVKGYMDINGVKVTSWSPDTDSVVGQDALGSIPRPYIRYQDAQGGVIQNSELAYMGHDGEKRRGFSLGGTTTNIEIKNNDFHHWWYAFFSAGVGKNITVEGNKYHDNYAYAIDPHTASHDIKIARNEVYNNAGYGIICSEDCSNLLIEGNVVHDNPLSSITLSKNVHNSIVRNNIVYNSEKGINFNASPDNEIFNNTIRNVTLGFYLTRPSDGSIASTSGNRIYNNTIENATVAVAANLNTDNNTLSNNVFVNTASYDYYLEGGSKMTIEKQIFNNHTIAGHSGEITIRNSGIIEIDGKPVDTGAGPYIKKLNDNMTIVVSSQ
jgi:mannuronan 5-epimerase